MLWPAILFNIAPQRCVSLASHACRLGAFEFFIRQAELFGCGVEVDDAAALGTARDRKMIERVAAFAAIEVFGGTLAGKPSEQKPGDHCQRDERDKRQHEAEDEELVVQVTGFGERDTV